MDRWAISSKRYGAARGGLRLVILTRILQSRRQGRMRLRGQRVKLDRLLGGCDRRLVIAETRLEAGVALLDVETPRVELKRAFRGHLRRFEVEIDDRLDETERKVALGQVGREFDGAHGSVARLPEARVIRQVGVRGHRGKRNGLADIRAGIARVDADGLLERRERRLQRVLGFTLVLLEPALQIGFVSFRRVGATCFLHGSFRLQQAHLQRINDLFRDLVLHCEDVVHVAVVGLATTGASCRRHGSAAS